MIHTWSGYGYRLGGSRNWNLHRFRAGDELRTAWYDETDPTHNLANRAEAAPRSRLGFPPEGHAEFAVPYRFVEAVEVSPAGWSRETGAPPLPSHLLPADADVLSPDRVAVAQYVLVIDDSLVDRDAEDLDRYRDDDIIAVDPAVGMVGDPSLDWDALLVDALTTLGLEPVGMPDWLWFRG